MHVLLGMVGQAGEAAAGHPDPAFRCHAWHGDPCNSLHLCPNRLPAPLQGKLQGRLLEFSTPQPVDECLAILGESMVRTDEMAAVLSVYAKAVKDGDVSTCPPAKSCSRPGPASHARQRPCHAKASRQSEGTAAGAGVQKVRQGTKIMQRMQQVHCVCGQQQALMQRLSRYSAPMQANEDDGKGLVEMVMDLLGIDPAAIGEDDNLAGMGIDSMQVVEVRARIQRALGRPIPLEEVRFSHHVS